MYTGYVWVISDMKEIIFKATFPENEDHSFGGMVTMIKSGKRFIIERGGKTFNSGKNFAHFDYQALTCEMKRLDITPEIDNGAVAGFHHMAVYKPEWYAQFTGHTLQSQVIQSGIKETEYTVKYDQKHGIKTRYHEGC